MTATAAEPAIDVTLVEKIRTIWAELRRLPLSLDNHDNKFLSNKKRRQQLNQQLVILLDRL